MKIRIKAGGNLGFRHRMKERLEKILAEKVFINFFSKLVLKKNVHRIQRKNFLHKKYIFSNYLQKKTN